MNALLSDNNNKRDENDLNLDWVSGIVRDSDSPVTVKLLCGADLLESFSVPGLWAESDVWLRILVLVVSLFVYF